MLFPIVHDEEILSGAAASEGEQIRKHFTLILICVWKQSNDSQSSLLPLLPHVAGRYCLSFILPLFFRGLLRELSHTATIAVWAHHDAISNDEMRTTTTIESSREEFNHFMCSCFWCALLVELTRDEHTYTHMLSESSNEIALNNLLS